MVVTQKPTAVGVGTGRFAGEEGRRRCAVAETSHRSAGMEMNRFPEFEKLVRLGSSEITGQMEIQEASQPDSSRESWHQFESFIL